MASAIRLAVTGEDGRCGSTCTKTEHRALRINRRRRARGEPHGAGDAKQRITILECEKRAAEGNATGEDLRDIGLYYQSTDPRKAIRYFRDAIARSWLQEIPWKERMAIYEARAAAYLATRQYDQAITDYEQAIEECREPGFEYRVLRKRAACYKEMGMDDRAQADRAAAAKAQDVYDRR